MNPILSMLNSSSQGNLLSQVNQIRNLLSGKNPDDVFQKMMNENPQFRSFVESNRGKTAEQIAAENGINLDKIKSML